MDGRRGAAVLVAGNVALDVIGAVDRMPAEHEKLRAGPYASGAGGSAVHTACGLVRLGVRVDLAAAVGEDPIGASCLADLASAGVGTGLVRRVAGEPTGLAVVFSTGASKRMVTFAGPDRSAAYDAVGELGAYAHVHVTGEATAALVRLVARARAAGCRVSAEWNGRDMSALAPHVGLSFMNADEFCLLTGCQAEGVADAALALAAKVEGAVVVTLGARGALWAGADGMLVSRPAVRVEPVDRTGGGDAFDAGAIAAYLGGGGPAACLDAGLAAAREAILVVGRPR